jgi:hypothetical protein
VNSLLQPTIRHDVIFHRGLREIHVSGRCSGESVSDQSGTGNTDAPKIGRQEIRKRDHGIVKARPADLSFDKASIDNCCTVEAVPPQTGAVQIRLLQRGISKIGIIGHCIAHQGPVEHRAGQFGRGKPRRLHSRFGQVCATQVRAGHLGCVKHCARKIAIRHFGKRQVGHVEIGANSRHIAQYRSAQFRPVKCGTGYIRAAQVNTAQIGLFEICTPQVTASAFFDRPGDQSAHLICKHWPCRENQDHCQNDAHSLSLQISKGLSHAS